MATAGRVPTAAPESARRAAIRKIVIIIILALIAIGAFAAAAAYAVERALAQPEEQGSEGHAEVIAVVQQFFDALNASDAEAAREVLVADGQFYSVREGEDGPVTRAVTHAEFIASLARGGAAVHERMFDPTATVRGRLAVLWAPYDFHAEGEFSHCGVDAFSLVRSNEGWKIAGITYSVETSGCESVVPR